MALFKKGDNFAQYQLYELIGRGSSAEVWQVVDNDGKYFALKVFAPDSGLDDYERLMFKEEYEKTLNLKHDNILQPLELSEFDSKPYIIMPLSLGSLMTDLRKRMIQRKIEGQDFHNLYDEDELTIIIHDVANALEYLRQNKIIHRDIKPDNILIFEENEQTYFKVTDFGVSEKIRRTIQKNDKLNTTGSGMTPAYAAPELYRGLQHERTDVFSLGVTIYELSCGELPVPHNGIGVGLAILNGMEPNDLPGNYSADFNALLRLMLESSPEKRISAKELIEFTGNYINTDVWPAALLEKGQAIIQNNSAQTQHNMTSANNGHSSSVPAAAPIVQSATQSTQTNQTSPIEYPKANDKGKKRFLTGKVTFNYGDYLSYKPNFKKNVFIALAFLLVGASVYGGITYYRNHKNQLLNEEVDKLILKGKFSDAANHLASADPTEYKQKIERLKKTASNYDQIKSQNNGFYIVRKNGKFGLINTDLKEKVKPKYSKIFVVNDRGFFVFESSTLPIKNTKDKISLLGVADSNGVEKIPGTQIRINPKSSCNFSTKDFYSQKETIYNLCK